MKYISKIDEFVSAKDYKKWSNDFNWNFYRSLNDKFQKFEDSDKRKNRIYFDLEVKNRNLENTIPQDVKDFLSWFQYPIESTELGLCKDKDGRTIKIGKLLKKLNKTDLLKSYERSRSTIIKKVDNLRVVISRHPYDIIGMSTNRGWTTCLNIEDSTYGGKHLSTLSYYLNRGCLIAYLIRKGDENIKNPISRILIKRVENYISPDYHIYGASIPEFEKFIKDWCVDFNQS